MLNMFLQRLQQHTNLATAAAILGTPAAAAVAAVPPTAALQQSASAQSQAAKGIKGGKHKNGGKKQGIQSILFFSRRMPISLTTFLVFTS